MSKQMFLDKTMIACVLQGENECDDQTTKDQATQAKMKNAFISQNVSSLQELGELHLPFISGS